MSFLGTDFIISSSIWLIIVFSFMFYFRKTIFKFYYKEDDIEMFLKKLKTYLKETYPKFNFQFDFINKLNEPNPDALKYQIIDNIIYQYISYDISFNSQSSISHDKIWSSYAFNSKPQKNKLPSDWLQRKSVVFLRDKKTCQRCSKLVDIKNSDLYIIKPIEQGGQYYIENLVLLCTDCKKIEESKRNSENNKIKYLDIKENLYQFVK